MPTTETPGRSGFPRLSSWLKHTTTWLVLFALGMLLGGTAWIWIYAFSTPGSHWSYVAVGMMTALAALLVGFFAGFLIGVPRVVSSGQARLTGGTFSPSTNLAEISDWLTKLLLGAGLVSLSHLGGPIGTLIDDVAGGLHGLTSNSAIIQAAKVTAGGVMIAFAVLGILVSYIVTSTWYQVRLERIFQGGTDGAPPQRPSNSANTTGSGNGGNQPAASGGDQSAASGAVRPDTHPVATKEAASRPTSASSGWPETTLAQKGLAAHREGRHVHSAWQGTADCRGAWLRSWPSL
jgi:hypothetical protein